MTIWNLITSINPSFLKAAITSTFPGKQNYHVEEIPDLAGKICLVTGGNGGIGYETCKAILLKNGKVYMAARSQQKAEEAIAQLKRETGSNQVEWLEVDLADLQSVKAAGEAFLRTGGDLHHLFLNAGIMTPPVSALTAQGYDLQYGTNVLGHAYLTKLLLPTLLRTYENTGVKPRIVSLSSMGHHLYRKSLPGFAPELTVPSKQRDSWDSLPLYGHSKLGNIIWANWLQRNYRDKIVSISVHPGVISSGLATTSSTPWWLKASYVTAFPVPIGAVTGLYGAFAPEMEGGGGKYLVPWARDGTATVDSRVFDVTTQDQLAHWVDQQIEKNGL